MICLRDRRRSWTRVQTHGCWCLDWKAVSNRQISAISYTHDGAGTRVKVSSDVTGLAFGTRGVEVKGKGEAASVEGVTTGRVAAAGTLLGFDELGIVAEPASNP